MTREEMIAAAKRKHMIEQAKAKFASQQESPDVVEEMHPDLKMSSRFLYKTLSNDPEAGFNMLQKEHPELNFKKEGDRILAKRPEEAEWGVLDPKGFDMQDISDLAWDVPAGAIETVASGAGGLAGGFLGLFGGPAAPVTVPVGALGGAATAGAATGAGLEGLRQKLGQWAGVNEEMDTDQIKTAAKWGAASPLLFGTGAAGKGVAKMGGKMLAKNAAGKEVLSETGEQLLKGQSGLLNRGFQGAKGAIAPRLGQLASGIDKDTLTYARNNLDKIEAAEQSATGGAEIYGALREKIQNSLDDKLAMAGEKLGEAGKSMDIRADIADVEAPMRDLLKKYEAKAMASVDKFGDDAVNKVDWQNYEYLKSKLEPYMQGSGELRGYDLKGYLDNLNEVTQISKNMNLATKPTVDKDLIRVSRQSASILDDQASQGAAGQTYKNFKREYGELKEIENNVVNKWFKDDMATERTLNNLLSRKGKAKKLDITRALTKLETPVDDAAKESIANSLFINPNMDALSSMGTTSTTRSVPLGGIGGTLGYIGGSRLGDGHGMGVLGAGVLGYAGSKVGSPYSMRKFMEADRFMNNLGSSVQNAGPGVMGLPQTGVNVWQQVLENER